MLNKKRLFALLMVGALLPTCVSAMQDNSYEEEEKVTVNRNNNSNNSGSSKRSKNTKDDQNKSANDAGLFGYVDKACNAVNTPLTIAMSKVTAFGAKSKLLITGLLVYLGYRVAPAVVEDVQEIPNAVKSLVGVDADCDGGECRSGKCWSEEA